MSETAEKKWAIPSGQCRLSESGRGHRLLESMDIRLSPLMD